MARSETNSSFDQLFGFKLDGGDVPMPMVRKDEPFPKPPKES
jgi:hypothetical protein